jgi:hypothetical protein
VNLAVTGENPRRAILVSAITPLFTNPVWFSNRGFSPEVDGLASPIIVAGPSTVPPFTDMLPIYTSGFVQFALTPAKDVFGSAFIALIAVTSSGEVQVAKSKTGL